MCFEGTYWGHTPTTYAHVIPGVQCDKHGEISTRGLYSCNTPPRTPMRCRLKGLIINTTHWA